MKYYLGEHDKCFHEVCHLSFMQYQEEMLHSYGINFDYLALERVCRYVEQNKVGFTVLAEDEDTGRIVGYIHLLYTNPYNMDPTHYVCQQTGWYVHPAYRGRGVGFGLLQRAEEEATGKVKMFRLGAAVTTDDYEGLVSKYKERGYMPFELSSMKVLPVPGGGG